jgi:hypothetical protein
VRGGPSKKAGTNQIKTLPFFFAKLTKPGGFANIDLPLAAALKWAATLNSKQFNSSYHRTTGRLLKPKAVLCRA